MASLTCMNGCLINTNHGKRCGNNMSNHICHGPITSNFQRSPFKVRTDSLSYVAKNLLLRQLSMIVVLPGEFQKLLIMGM